MALNDLFSGEGDDYLKLPAGALLTAVIVPKPAAGHRSAYEKIRVRQSIDFPLAGVAVGVDGAGGRPRMGLTGVGSRPLLLELDGLGAGPLSEEGAEIVRKQVQRAVSPVRTTLIPPQYRRRAIAAKAASILRRLLAGRADAHRS